MPLPPIVSRWQNANKRWAQRRCSDLGLPYQPLWNVTPHLAQPSSADIDYVLGHWLEMDPVERDRWREIQREAVILQWAGMNLSERIHWGEVYRDLDSIPGEMIERERERQARMVAVECSQRVRQRYQEQHKPAIEPETLDTEFRLVSASEVAAHKKRKRKKAS